MVKMKWTHMALLFQIQPSRFAALLEDLGRAMHNEFLFEIRCLPTDAGCGLCCRHRQQSH